MMTDNGTFLDREQRLEQVLVECLEELEAGRTADGAALLARYPEFAVEVAELVAGRGSLDRFMAPLRAVETPQPDAVTIGERGLHRNAQPPDVGRSFGDYELLEEIARGGMGVVYKARQKSLNRLVALKMLFPGGQSRDDIERFLRTEAEVAAGLEHPHIVPIYEFGQEHAAEGQPLVPFLSMKLIEGGSLKEAVVRGEWAVDSKEQQRRAARLLTTVARAVHHAHQRGILHRDLKPGNILLDAQGQPFVTDFGLAQRVEGDGPHGQSGVIVGTALYMAPEQAAGQKRLTTAADVYSLGAILYELVTGRPPFQGDSIVDTLLQVKVRTPVRPRALNARLDRDLETICLKCLDKEPQYRYGSAEALADDLERWQANEPIRARPAGQAERLWRWARRNPLVAGLSAAVVLVAALGFAGVLGQWQAALTHEQQANANAAQAKDERDEAQKQRDEVKALNEKLRAAQTAQQRILYAAHMNLAHTAWAEAAVPRVLELLEQHRPKPGEPDQPGFEWHYLYRLCHSERLTLQGHAKTVVSVAFSPDGKRLASASRKDVKVWDAQTGLELLDLKDAYGSVAFSSDGKRLASAYWDPKTKQDAMRVWDAQTGQELFTIKGYANWVINVVFSPDGKRLVGADGGGSVKVCDAQTGLVLFSLKGHTDHISSVVFSPDGKRLASASYDNTVKIWDAQTGQQLLSLEGMIECVAFSPDGKRLASVSRDGKVKVQDAQTSQELFSLKGGQASSVSFSPDGKQLVSGSWFGTVRICDSQTGAEIRTIKGGGRIVVFSPDGQRLAGSSDDKTVKVWDAQNENLTLQGGDGESVAFSPDFRLLASASSDNTVTVRDARTGQTIQTLKGHTSAVKRMFFSPDGKRLASVDGGRRDDVKVWDVQSGKELFTLPVSLGAVGGVAFSPDGKRLATASGTMPPVEPFKVKVWDAHTGKELHNLKGHTRGVHSVAFSPDGKRLAGGAFGPEVKVWDVQTGAALPSIKGQSGFPGSVAYSPDGKRLANAYGKEVKVCDTQTGKELFTLKGHSATPRLARRRYVIGPKRRTPLSAQLSAGALPPRRSRRRLAMPDPARRPRPLQSRLLPRRRHRRRRRMGQLALGRAVVRLVLPRRTARSRLGEYRG